ncbi:MAG: site-specific integrase [Henriciella sp.]|uniref:tyrosine-type recombinase/integrase n=1 Tax=Henriciella sp. TaxID=1968823 RepID=UPI003C787680
MSDVSSQIAELLPAVSWDQLPTMDVAGTFVSQHANPVDAMLVELGSANSKRAYESRLAGVARLLPEPMDVRTVPWQNLSYLHVIAIKAALQDAGMSPTSTNATLAAIRKIAKVCVRMNLMDRDEMLNIQDVAMLRVHRLPAGREVRIGELEAIIRTCRDDQHAAAAWRDIAVLGFLYICGMRRFEVAAIDVEHYDRETSTLRVIGKGNKERLSFPDPGTHAAVEHWIEHRQDFDGPLFLPVKKSGEVNYATGRISDQAIYNIVKKRQQQAGVQACSPHDFRRTFGTELLRQGIDLATVQRLMGHSDPSTTARYDVRVSEEDRRATRGLHLPVGEALE